VELTPVRGLYKKHYAPATSATVCPGSNTVPVAPRGLRSLLWARSKPRRILSAFSLAIFTVTAGTLGILQFFGISAGASTPAAAPGSSRLSLGKLQITEGANGGAESIDVTVHNRGGGSALLTKLDVTINRFLYVPSCSSQGEVDASAIYPLTLPDNPAPGTKLALDLHDDAPADGFDRFTVPLGAPKEAQPTHATKGGSFLYQVTLEMETDDGKPPLFLGQALVATPHAPSNGYVQFWDLTNPDRFQSVSFMGERAPSIGECLDANSRELAAFLQLTGERSTRISELTSGGLPKYVRAHSSVNQFGP
jgi:hypothetical protein